MEQNCTLKKWWSAFLIFLMCSGQISFACDRSEISLDSITWTGGKYNIFVSMRIGAGIGGALIGAGGPTRTFGFNFFGPPGLALSYYTPVIKSDTTGASYNSSVWGSIMGSNFMIAYLDPGVDYTCIQSQALCGRPHTDRKQIRFELNQMPDSIRLLGVEASGNPIGGCFPNLDMVIRFGSLPVVWAGFIARAENGSVELNWATASESNTLKFVVTRSLSGDTFEPIADVPAIGNSREIHHYNFNDHAPPAGNIFYRIEQVDLDGKSAHSEVVSVAVQTPSGLSFYSLSPIPSKGELNIGISSGLNDKLTLCLLDTRGTLSARFSFDVVPGNNLYLADISMLPAGMYCLKIQGKEGMIMKKIVKV